MCRLEPAETLTRGDTPGTTAFFSATLGWRFAVDEDDWRRATKITVGDYPIGGVSDLANPVYPPGTPAHIAYHIERYSGVTPTGLVRDTRGSC